MLKIYSYHQRRIIWKYVKIDSVSSKKNINTKIFGKLKGQSWKLCNNKHMIALTLITDTET